MICSVVNRPLFISGSSFVVVRTSAPCHHPGEAAPFSLLTYGDLKSHARQTADLTEKRVMPPWLPGPSDANFTGDLHLSADEILLFRKWVADGILEGDASDLPPAPRFNAGWQLGKPDIDKSKLLDWLSKFTLRVFSNVSHENGGTLV